MNRADSKRFAELMSILNEVYGDPTKPINEIKVEVYWKSLNDLSIQEFDEAVTVLLRTKTIKTFPTPAEILAMVRSSIDEKAELAFNQLISTIQSYGYYDSVVFEDGTIGKCVEAMGGWLKVADWEVDDRRFNRMEFVKLYKIFAARGEWGPIKMIGAHELHNSAKGLRGLDKPAIMISREEDVKILPTNRKALES